MQVAKCKTTLCNSSLVLKQFGKNRLLKKTDKRQVPNCLNWTKQKNCPL